MSQCLWSIAACCAAGACVAWRSAQAADAPPPTPAWVRMIDQGALDPALAGISTPEGIHVDVEASSIEASSPDGGSPQFYFQSGTVLGRQGPAANGGRAPDEAIVRGLAGEAGSARLFADGMLLIVASEGDQHGQGSDGSPAVVFRSGAVFQSLPDGAELIEFARGLCQPRGSLVEDDYGNRFLIDALPAEDQAAPGARLLHVLEGADYGWRLAPGATCCQADAARSATLGDRPGMKAAMLEVGGSAGGVMRYGGTSFPEFFRGLLIVPVPDEGEVWAYRIERSGATFMVAEAFTLLRGGEGFRPAQAIEGADGAIYVVDPGSRPEDGSAPGDGSAPRTYRLIWSGTDEHPAIAPQARDAWTDLDRAANARLWALLDSPHALPRGRAQAELARRGAANRARFNEVALAKGRSGPARAMALWGACRFYDESVQQVCLRLLRDADPELRRLAAEALGRHATGDPHESIRQLGVALNDAQPAVRRAAALAHGRLVGRLRVEDEMRFRHAIRLSLELLPAENNDALVLDGVARGLERVGTMGVTRLLQFAFSNDEAKTEAAVAGFERLRTPVAIRGLNQMLQGDTDGLSDDQIRRIIACYRNIQVDPPPSVLSVVEWLTAHPQAAPDVQIAAMATLAVAGDDPARARPLAAALLAHPDAAARMAAIQSIGQWRLTVVAPDLLTALKDPFRQPAERQAMIAALDRLRPDDAPREGIRVAPGVELPLEDLLALARNRQSRAIQADLLALLARADAGRIERLVAETGDRQSGRQVFDDARRGRCVTCHALAAPADGVGPDLTTIGQDKSLAWLIEAIGHPSRGIAAGHEAWRVETDDGAAHVGRIEAESPAEVVLRGADGGVTRLPAQRIVKRAMLAESLMPDVLEANLGFQEFIDLLALLRSR